MNKNDVPVDIDAAPSAAIHSKWYRNKMVVNVLLDIS